jgi:hypothetical protein
LYSSKSIGTATVSPYYTNRLATQRILQHPRDRPGFGVGWNAGNKTVTISRPLGPANGLPTTSAGFNGGNFLFGTAWDFGYTTYGSSASNAVGVFNLDTSGHTATITWAQIGVASNTPLAIYDVWGATPALTFSGMATNAFVTPSIGAGDTALYLFVKPPLCITNDGISPSSEVAIGQTGDSQGGSTFHVMNRVNVDGAQLEQTSAPFGNVVALSFKTFDGQNQFLRAERRSADFGNAANGFSEMQFWNGAGANLLGYFGDVWGGFITSIGVNGTLWASNNFTAGSITNRASAGSRMQITDANKKIIDAAASGAVPINADGTATTAGQLQTVGAVDSTAWHTNGDSSVNNSIGILGYTNGNDMQMRQNVNGVNGATTLELKTVANNDSVSFNVGTSNSVNNTSFNPMVLGYKHTVSTATDPTIAGGARNSIGGNGHHAFVAGGSTNTADGAWSFASGQAAWARNDNSFVFNGIANIVLATSGSGGDNGKILLGGTGFEFTNSGYGSFKFFGNNPANSTNLQPIANAPDFNYAVQVFLTNDVVQFKTCTNVDSSGKFYQSTIIFVTNNLAAGNQKAIIAPLNCRTSNVGTGVPFVTNLTKVVIEQYGQKWTNMACYPIF